MKALLICPDRRAAVSALAESTPLAAMPLAGKCLIEYWMEHLVRLGTKEVEVVSSDRPHIIRDIVQNGERWGLRARVIEETRELNVSQTRMKYQPVKQTEWLAPPFDVTLMDHFPNSAEFPLFTSYADLFTNLQLWLPRAHSSDRIGVREIQPGIWAGLHTHIAPTAKLHSPCWLGSHVWIGANAVVGPMTIVENRVCIEPNAEISQSVIGPDTFVGAFTEVKNSFASGNTLINWKNGVRVQVPDAFVLSALKAGANSGWMHALRSLYVAGKEEFQFLLRQLSLRKESWDAREYERSAASRKISNQ